MRREDLTGKICPFAVVEVIRRVERMQPGETVDFTVNDPLALKSIPEELSEYDDLSCSISESGAIWIITVCRNA